MTKPKPATQADDARPRRSEPPREPSAAPDPRIPETPVRTPERPAGGPPGIMTRDAPAAVDLVEQRQPQAGGRGVRSVAVTPESYDASARTVRAVLSAGSPVRRYYFTEELEISPEAIDLGRVTAGICPLLDTHNQYTVDAQLGRITDVTIENGQLIGTLHFNETDAGRAVEARVAAGEPSFAVRPLGHADPRRRGPSTPSRRSKPVSRPAGR